MSTQLVEPSLFEPLSGYEREGGERTNLRDILSSFERNLIITVLLAAGGNQKRAAEALGVLPTTFQEKLKRFGLLNQRPGRRVRGGERTPVQDAPIKPQGEATNPPQENPLK